MIKNLRGIMRVLICIMLIAPVRLVHAGQSFEDLLALHQGKVIYLDFWASWCGPCRKSFPWMNALQAKYQQQGLVIIGVNLDSDSLLAHKFLETTPANFTLFYDPQGELARLYQVKGMPSSYLINKRGQLINSHVGFSSSKIDYYEQEIMRLLNE